MSASALNGPQRPAFVLFGDSLTQHSFGPEGWGSSLQHLYARKVDVILRGYSGYNTRWALHLLPGLFPPTATSEASPYSTYPPAVVTVFFGANDAALLDRTSSKQHVPIPEYKQNLHSIVDHLLALTPTPHVILITPPPVDEPGRMAFARETYGDKAMKEPERLNAVTGEYAAACRSVAESYSAVSGKKREREGEEEEGNAREQGEDGEATSVGNSGSNSGICSNGRSGGGSVALLDAWTTMQEQPKWQALLSDGLHLTAEGNQFLFHQLVALINSHPEFSDLVQEVMKWDFPQHLDIDGADPAAAFKKA